MTNNRDFIKNIFVSVNIWGNWLAQIENDNSFVFYLWIFEKLIVDIERLLETLNIK